MGSAAEDLKRIIQGDQTPGIEHNAANLLKQQLASARENNPVASGARASLQQSRVHQPVGGGEVPAQVDLARSVPGATSEVADAAQRAMLGKGALQDAGTAVEVGSGLASGPLGRVASAALKTEAGSLAGRAVRAGTTAAVEGAASAFAGAIDPDRDALESAALSATLGGFSDFAAISMIDRARRGKPDKLEFGARDAIEQADRKGSAIPSAGRLTRSRAIDTAENITENSLVGGGRVGQRNLVAEANAQVELDKFVEEWIGGSTRVEIDALTRSVTAEGNEAFTEVGKKIFSQMDALDEIGVDTTGIINIRNSLVRENQSGIIDDKLKKIVMDIDKMLGVSPERRGIDAGFQISTTPRIEIRRLNPIFPAEPIKVRDASPRIKWSDAQKLRSDALRVGRSSTDLISGQPQAAAERLAGAADAAMELSATVGKDANPEAFAIFREGNAFWKDGAESFNDGVIATLANLRPDDLFKTIFAKDSPEQVARFRRIVLGGVGGDESTIGALTRKHRAVLRDPKAPAFRKEIARIQLTQLAKGKKAWDKFQGQFMLNILRGADDQEGLLGSAASNQSRSRKLKRTISKNPDSPTGRMAAEELALIEKNEKIGVRPFIGNRTRNASTVMTRLNSFGDDMLREVFPLGAEKQRRNFGKLARIVEITQSGTGLGIGTFATQMAQAGAVFQAVTSPGSSPRAGIILVVPEVMSRLMNSDSFIRWATIGMKVKPGTERATQAWVQMAQIAAREGARVVGHDGKVLSDGNFQETGTVDPRLSPKGLDETLSVVRSRGDGGRGLPITGRTQGVR